MEATIWVNKNVSLKASGNTDKELFKELAKAQSSKLFEDSVCGHCGSENIKFIVREVEGDNEYYELQCQDCKHKLVFGHAKAGYMYPKRFKTDKKGISLKTADDKPVFLDNKGWLPPFKKDEDE